MDRKLRVFGTTHMTGALMARTAFHSAQLSGRMEKSDCRNGMYSKAKCSAIDRAMAYTSIMFSHTGSVRSDSLDDSAFMALNISMTTRIDSETVDPALAISLPNIWQPISGKSVEQRWKCDSW